MPLALKSCNYVISSHSFICCWRHRTKTLIDIYFENFWTRQEFRELLWFSNCLTKPYKCHCHWIRWSWRPYADSSFWCRTIMLFENIKKIKHERQTAIKIFRHFCCCTLFHCICKVLKPLTLNNLPFEEKKSFSKKKKPDQNSKTKLNPIIFFQFYLFLKDLIWAQVHTYIITLFKDPHIYTALHN